MTTLTIWARDAGYGIAWTATRADEGLDMTHHGYSIMEELETVTTDEEARRVVSGNAEEIKELKRAKLIAQLEALDNE